MVLLLLVMTIIYSMVYDDDDVTCLMFVCDEGKKTCRKKTCTFWNELKICAFMLKVELYFTLCVGS